MQPESHITKSGNAFIVRQAIIEDAPGILELSKAVIGEEVFQLTSSDEFKLTLEDEKKWISSFSLKGDKILLVAVKDSEVIGLLDFSVGHRQRIKHTGEFGMSVSSLFRGQGVGSALIDTLLKWAKAHGGIEKICLQVHASNDAARALYQKFGFEVEGVRKRDLKYGPNKYVDSILMARFI